MSLENPLRMRLLNGAHDSQCQGDGHCFYRCLWHIARTNVTMSEILFSDKKDEDIGVQEIRNIVAIWIRNDRQLEYIQNVTKEYENGYRMLSDIKIH